MITANTTPSSVSSVPVLIVGAGPVGLFAAYLLTKLGIQVRVIDREKDVSPLSKATLMHARSLEVFQFTGIIDEFLKVGVVMDEINLFVDNKYKATVPLLGGGGDTQYSAGLVLEQSKTSEVMIQELIKLGVKVDFGWELVDTKVVEQSDKDGDGNQEPYVQTVIRKALSDKDTDMREVLGRVDLLEQNKDREYEVETIRSQYMVASDGGRSTVRHKLDIGFPGRTLPKNNFMWDGTCECDMNLSSLSFVAGVDKMMVVFPLTNGDIRLIFLNVEPEENEDFAKALENLTVEKFEEMVTSIIAPSRFKIKTTSWLTGFKINERRAETFVHKNRIFLAGDAAHVHSPAGGQGLNTGLLDAHNLAWKLALVLNKVAPETLLDSYGERMAMADRSIELSQKMLKIDGTSGFVGQFIKRLSYTFAPYLLPIMKALKIQPDSALNQLGVRYEENALNRAHATQPHPRSEHQVGTRARDGPIRTVGVFSSDTKPTELRVHDLLFGIGRFHILVFASDMLTTSSQKTSVEIEGILTTDAKKLAYNVGRFKTQWRSKWSYGSNINDGHKDKDLLKIHIIANSFTPDDSLDELSQRKMGEGKVFLDHTKVVHQKYGFELNRGHGGIVVVRPDTYVGYRLNGADDQAWEDVHEYFSSILSI
ncbi:hypothetical protein BGX28_002813 [Mortierella sp. GBA30]|nr:hypothetical protein BGX28_002813 [Mortierella sp. GBA30]